MLRGVAPDDHRKESRRDAGTAAASARSPCCSPACAPRPISAPTIRPGFDAIYPRLAEKYGVPLYPFFLDGVAAEPELLLEDGMHPNAEGVDRMVERILPAVEKTACRRSRQRM